MPGLGPAGQQQEHDNMQIFEGKSEFAARLDSGAFDVYGMGGGSGYNDSVSSPGMLLPMGYTCMCTYINLHRCVYMYKCIYVYIYIYIYNW